MDENNELNDDQNLNEQPEPAAFSNPDEAADTSNVLTNLADFDDLDETQFGADVVSESFEFLQDLEMNVYIELGRTKMPIKDVLELERGYVIELNKLASEPVDIFVNNKKIAEGEVVVVDKHFGIRITTLNKLNNLKEMYS
ncbi:MAG: flagellar motor switch protein FliN [Melioribacteraceae bacterium]|jgi:flagellar motor switch protein FliN/FliY|nr:flagellar motor switch protein FliN [Melioribacteraceae bacterium]